MEVKVGDKAPDFALPSQMGDTVTLSEYTGKKNVVLYFYPKDETIGCMKEACAFRDSYDAFTELGAEVLGVSGQSVESHKGFASHHGLPFLLLAGIVLFSGVVFFQVVNLPVEFNASKRGLRLLQTYQLADGQEIRGAKAVLDAAALTYVAALLQALITILYYVSIMNRRRN